MRLNLKFTIAIIVFFAFFMYGCAASKTSNFVPSAEMYGAEPSNYREIVENFVKANFITDSNYQYMYLIPHKNLIKKVAPKIEKGQTEPYYGWYGQCVITEIDKNSSFFNIKKKIYTYYIRNNKIIGWSSDSSMFSSNREELDAIYAEEKNFLQKERIKQQQNEAILQRSQANARLKSKHSKATYSKYTNKNNYKQIKKEREPNKEIGSNKTKEEKIDLEIDALINS